MIVRISAGYGVVSKIHPNGHTGIDYAVPLKTPLHAPYDGIVSSVRDYGNSSLGKAVFVKKADETQYVLGHLSEVKVKVGQVVEQGDLLALSGTTGRSTGPHLHYGEFALNGQPIDPGYITFDSFQSTGMMEHWANNLVYGTVDNIVDVLIFFSPQIITLCLLLFGFKLMLSPLWR